MVSYVITRTHPKTLPEVHLRALLTKQHSYIEDIKKKSNFYKTKEMLDKYAEEPSSSPVRRILTPVYRHSSWLTKRDPEQTRGTPVRRQNAGIPQAPSTPVRAGAPGPTSNPSARNAPVTPQRAMVALGSECRLAGCKRISLDGQHGSQLHSSCVSRPHSGLAQCSRFCRSRRSGGMVSTGGTWPVIAHADKASQITLPTS